MPDQEIKILIDVDVPAIDIQECCLVLWCDVMMKHVNDLKMIHKHQHLLAEDNLISNIFKKKKIL